MNLDKTLNKINHDRERIEACFVFCLWKNPELYDEYLHLNEDNDKTLKNKDAIFYYLLGKNMYKSGIRIFDCVSCDTFLENKKDAKQKYEEYGGYHEIEQLKNIVHDANIDAFYDQIVKMNTLTILANKYDEIFEDIHRFDDASSEDVFNTFELLNNSVSLITSNSENIEDLVIDEDFIDDLKSGKNIGYNYGKYCPLLNYITLGAMPRSLYMIGGHSGTGKSSFAFESIIMGLHYSHVKTAIISNEMNIETYKVLLLSHILTQDLNYWKLTRKQIRMGKFTEEQETMIRRAMDISKEKYSDILFVKLFDNDMNKISKYLKRLSAQGVGAVFYDTFKSDDMAVSDQLWKTLMLDSRRLHQLADRLNLCIFTTYQLALHTTNQRYLNAACLSNSKQIKEVYETMVYCRPVWPDEFPGEKNDIKPYKINKENKKTKDDIVMDKEKKYLLFFLDKTRADEDKQVLLYEWNARFNNWKELGFARVIDDHVNY